MCNKEWTGAEERAFSGPGGHRKELPPYQLTRAAAVRLSLLCLLLVLCRRSREEQVEREHRFAEIASCLINLASNLCRYSGNYTRCAQRPLPSPWTVLSLTLFPMPGWDTGQKTKTSVIRLHINTLNCFESKWRSERTARVLADAFGEQTTALWEAIHRDMAKSYRLQTQPWSL